MHLTEIVLLSIGLGFDAFFVAIGIGFIYNGPKQVFRLAWHFGLFQAIMPFIGWQIGGVLSGMLTGYSKYVACLILVGIGGHIIWNSLTQVQETSASPGNDRTRGWSLILLSLATSIDALGAGISLGLVLEKIFMICVFIGVTAASMTIMGMWIGKKASSIINPRVEAFAGIILVLLGIKMGFY